VNEELTAEDRTILAALEAPGEPLASGEPSDPSETAEMMARLYTEVLGLLPFELEPEAPRSEVKARLLAAARGEAAPAVPPAASEAMDETQEVDPRPAPLPPPVQTSRPVLSRERPSAPRVAMVSRRRSVWPALLAASLILALGGLSGWLFLRQTRMEETIARLESDLAAERRERGQSESAMTGMRSAMERMRVNFAMVTAPAVKVSPLRPVDGQSPARGTLFVAADDQHWYLAVHGLPPAAPDRDYQLWWVADEGRMVSGGTFDPTPGEKVEMFSETMPERTQDVVITLEPEGGVEAPTGPEILRGAGVVYQL